METLACIKRVPDTGAEIILTDDGQGVDASTLGYTISPHEECAIEEAVQVVEDEGGNATVMSLGPDDATEQIFEGIARGADDGILVETDPDDEEWGPKATANALADAIREHSDGDELGFDVLFFGNESADNANFQVGIAVATELDLPVVTGVKDFEVDGDTLVAKRDVPGGSEVFEVDTPAVITVKEGLNTPRYPSMRSRMQAKKQEIARIEPSRIDEGVTKVKLEVPEKEEGEAEILGEGPDASGAAVELLEELEVL